MPAKTFTAERRLSTETLKAQKATTLSNRTDDSPGIKYPLYKEIISEATKGYPPHTRLPSIRDLAATLDISLVTAQRTVTELIQDGILYSRPKAGVYTAENALQKPEATNQEAPHNPYFESICSFATESTADFQSQSWQKLGETFTQRYPNIRTEMKFVENADALSKADVYERLNWNTSPKHVQPDSLDLRTFLPPQLAEGCTPEGLLPLYFRSNFLFFNGNILKQHGIPLPDYRNFAEQCAYLEQIATALEAANLKSKPCAVQQPVTLLGTRHLEDFFQLADRPDTDTATTERFIRTIEALIAFCRLNERAPGFQNPKAHEERLQFMEGTTSPFFLGHSVDYWRFTERPLNFQWGCYPTLNTDDTLFLWPMVGAISSNSPHPAECSRLLTFLVSDQAQQEFARTGSFPANPSTVKTPVTDAEPDWLRQTFDRSKPMRLSSPIRSYLTLNILNNELWHALLDHVPVEQAVHEAIQMGRAYLQQNKQTARVS